MKKTIPATTGVQSAYVIKGDHHVLIMCLLSTGSTARGCVVSMELASANGRSSEVETQLFHIPTSDSTMAQKCIRISRSLRVISVQVFDWTEDSEMGGVIVPSTILESSYTPCEL